MDHATLILTRAEIALMQGALALAMNAADGLAARASLQGDDAALAGFGTRAMAYHRRAADVREQSADMFKLLTRLINEYGDLRKENQR